jgi:hypothetical protein
MNAVQVRLYMRFKLNRWNLQNISNRKDKEAYKIRLEGCVCMYKFKSTKI